MRTFRRSYRADPIIVGGYLNTNMKCIKWHFNMIVKTFWLSVNVCVSSMLNLITSHKRCQIIKNTVAIKNDLETLTETNVSIWNTFCKMNTGFILFQGFFTQEWVYVAFLLCVRCERGILSYCFSSHTQLNVCFSPRFCLHGKSEFNFPAEIS